MEDTQQTFVLAGRETQLEQLHQGLIASLSGRPQVALITGEAGDGKTTLVREFCRQAQEAHNGLIVTYSECGSQGGVGDLYQPFKEVIGLLTGGEEVSDRLASRTINSENTKRLKQFASQTIDAILKIGPDVLGVLFPWWGITAKAGAWVLEKTGWTQLQAAASTDATKAKNIDSEQLFEQFSRLVIGIAKITPLILVVDDLHWADQGTLNLYLHLARRIKDQEGVQMLLIGLYRPSEVASGREGNRHPADKTINEIGRYWGKVAIHLEDAIGGQSGREFIDGVLDTEPNQLDRVFRNNLFRLTEGHPLFVVEILHFLQERGDLAKNAQGEWSVPGQLDFSRLPDSVLAVIRERIAGLSEDLKDILTCGSVEGEEFTAEMIGRVRQVEELQLAKKLSDELDKQRHLVTSKGEIRFNQKRFHIYRFMHALFRQQIYGGLDNWQRQLLHRSVGDALELLYGEESSRIAAQLARHFHEALEDQKALHYFLLAGGQAKAAYSYADAVELYRQAEKLILELKTDDTALKYKIAYSLAQVLALVGNTAESQVEIDRALSFANEIGDQSIQADIYNLQAKLFTQIGHYLGTIEAGQTALKLAEEGKDETKIADVQLLLGEACRFLAEHDNALGYLKSARDYYLRQGNEDSLADTFRQIALVHLNRNEYANALEQAQQALSLFKQTRNRVGENQALRCIGDVYSGMGDYEQALEKYQEVLLIRREIGHRAREGGALGDIGDIYLFLGFYQESLDLHLQSLAINKEVDYKYGQTWCHHDLGVIYYNMGKSEDARGELREAIALAEQIQAQDLIVRSKNDLSLALREDNAQENLELALHLASEATRISERTGLVFGQIVGESYQAMACLNLGNMVEAMQHSEKAVTVLEQRGVAEVLEEEIYFNNAKILHAAGNDLEADRYLKKAHAELMEKADKITNAMMRDSFLENVLLNRELVATLKNGW